jgi:hypothetical protein
VRDVEVFVTWVVDEELLDDVLVYEVDVVSVGVKLELVMVMDMVELLLVIVSLVRVVKLVVGDVEVVAENVVPVYDVVAVRLTVADVKVELAVVSVRDWVKLLFVTLNVELLVSEVCVVLTTVAVAVVV